MCLRSLSSRGLNKHCQWIVYLCTQGMSKKEFLEFFPVNSTIDQSLDSMFTVPHLMFQFVLMGLAVELQFERIMLVFRATANVS